MYQPELPLSIGHPYIYILFYISDKEDVLLQIFFVRDSSVAVLFFVVHLLRALAATAGPRIFCMSLIIIRFTQSN